MHHDTLAEQSRLLERLRARAGTPAARQRLRAATNDFKLFICRSPAQAADASVEVAAEMERWERNVRDARWRNGWPPGAHSVTPVGLLDLPLEVLRCILASADCGATLCRAGEACCALRHAVTSDEVWRPVACRYFRHPATADEEAKQDWAVRHQRVACMDWCAQRAIFGSLCEPTTFRGSVDAWVTRFRAMELGHCRLCSPTAPPAPEEQGDEEDGDDGCSRALGLVVCSMCRLVSCPQHRRVAASDDLHLGGTCRPCGKGMTDEAVATLAALLQPRGRADMVSDGEPPM